MLIRLEKLGTDEVGLLVDGRPKGTWKLPSLKYPEQSSGIFLLLGGLLPQQRSKEYKNSVQLDEVLPFYGCLSELSVNGNLVGLKNLIDKKDSIAVNLNRCPVKTEKGEVEEEEEEERGEEEETEEEKEEEREDYATTTSTPSTTPPYFPVVTDVTEDPLLEVKDVGYREQEVKSKENKYEPEFVEASVEPPQPGILLDTLSPDPLPTVIKETQTPEAIYSTIQMGNDESTISSTTEESEEDEGELTTLMPAPSVFSSEEFPHMISDLEEVIQFKLRTRARYGLVFWQGQHPSLDRREGTEQFGEDFLAISLLGGHLSFTYELGGGAAQLLSKRPVNDGRTHLIRATRRGRNGTLQINRGKIVEGRSSGILAMLNVEGNIFIGGVPDLNIMTAGMFNQNFVGCLGEVELNGQRIDLMANAIDGRN
uniref:Laminin G domain-containing protein n=1 Tax=Meloidogyne javanica TaxID=6303 RepID=A0A915LI62_MELJA